MRLRGKVALVTGAARGIGRGIAEVLAEEGADVAVNDYRNIDQAEEVVECIRAHGRRAMAVGANVSRRPEVEAMFERVWKDLGPVGTVAAFLASDDASYLTGQSFFVDGGWEGK